MKKLNLDVLRFIATLMVVAIHIYPFTFIHEDFDYALTRVLFRMAVPFFFMITGYYVLAKSLNEKQILKKYTKKIVKLYGISIFIYVPILLYNGYFQDFSFLKFIRDILVEGPFYHLWYFPALILGLWISYFLIKKMGTKKTVFIVFFLYLIGLFGDSYYGLNPFKGVYDLLFVVSPYTRNGLFYAPLFLVMGYSIQKKKRKKNYFWWGMVSLVCLLSEGMTLYYMGIPRHNSMYIFLIPFVFIWFSFILSKCQGENKKIRNTASWLYILHPFFIVVVRLFSKVCGLAFLVENHFALYLVDIFCTLCCIFLFSDLKKYRKNFL